ADEGWGAHYLSLRGQDGHWGEGFYQPKWTSTHYTLLDLRNMEISPDIPIVQKVIEKILIEEKGRDGGVNPARSLNNSDVCINGMFLCYACYFGEKEDNLKTVVDFLLEEQMSDGGFNCRSNRSGAMHSSMHTTISVLEGILEYFSRGYTYRADEMKKAARGSEEFLLTHKLYLSDRTGNIIDEKFTRLPYPARWRYDILRALEYFADAGNDYDDRMKPAINLLISKRNKNGKWPLNAKHPGQVHIEFEKAGKESRINTLRALKVLKHFDFLKYL
ncbi:MAG: hypothetical protein ACLFR2_11875, partial [Candidatus Kapaibacterium sp.]